MPATTATEAPVTTEAPATLSEHQAAKQLNVLVGTLRLWRVKGKLAPGLVKETPSLAPGGRPKIEYDAAWVLAYAGTEQGDEPAKDIFAGDDVEATPSE